MQAPREKLFAWPIKAPLKLGNGYRARMESGALHGGQDMARGQLGKDVAAAAAGKVTKAGVHLIDKDKKPDARGIWIRIEHTMADGSRWATVYEHLQETLQHDVVEVGFRVLVRRERDSVGSLMNN
jgi:murein DD-endopeptidase MepM/ murein hydrolase activator NlpD